MPAKAKRAEQIPEPNDEEQEPSTSESDPEPSDGSSGEDSDEGSSDDDSSDGEDDEGDEDVDEEELVNADFEFFDPKEVDYHGLKALMNQYLDGADFPALPQLLDTVIAQTTVGTVVKSSDDLVSPVGFITVLNLEKYAKESWMKQILDFLTAKCSAYAGPSGSSFLTDLIARPKGVGLVLSERLLNIPMQVAPPLHDALFDEVSWATEDEPTEEARRSFMLEHYIFVSRVFWDTVVASGQAGASTKDSGKQQKKGAATASGKGKGQDGAGPSSDGAPAGKKRKVSPDDAAASFSASQLVGDRSDMVYVKVEDTVLHALAHWSCVFPAAPVHSGELAQKGLVPMRLVAVLHAGQVAAFRKQLTLKVADEERKGAQGGGMKCAEDEGERGGKKGSASGAAAMGPPPARPPAGGKGKGKGR
eukprot:jgi/Mesvir1/1694/Mv21154-RA.1